MKETYLQYAQRKCNELNVLGLEGFLNVTMSGKLSTGVTSNYFMKISYQGYLLGSIMFHTDGVVYGGFVNSKDPQLREILMAFLAEDGIQLQGAKDALKKWYQEQLEKEQYGN